MLVECCAVVVALRLRRWALLGSPNSAAPIGAPRPRSKTMTADSIRNFSTWFAALFVSALLVAASTSAPFVA
jgi:hypothetical protein